MVAGTQERTERVLILWLIDVANSGHIPPRTDTGSSCFDDGDSRPGDIDRSLEFSIRSGRWSEGDSQRID